MALEAEKKRQKEEYELKLKIAKEDELKRIAALEFEKNKLKEVADVKLKLEKELEVAKKIALEADEKRKMEEKEAKLRAQKVVELENEISNLKAYNQSNISNNVSQKNSTENKIESIRSVNDPLVVFDGTWVSVNPPVFYLIFNKVALGIRQVSLPNIGQGNIKLSDGANGSNFQISAANINCYYFVTFTNNRQKMIMELKAGESLCLQSSILEKAE